MSKKESLSSLETLSHAIPLAKRKDLGPVFTQLAGELSLTEAETKHLTWPTPSWPNRAEASVMRADVVRYSVDFAHGDQPDRRNFGATFEEVRQLLRYTRDSCKVAFGTGKGVVDRTRRPTKLGPCVITRLPHVIDLKDYLDVLPFQVKLDEHAKLQQKVGLDAAGNKLVVPRGGNKY